jgi:hypothetical protein
MISNNPFGVRNERHLFKIGSRAMPSVGLRLCRSIRRRKSRACNGAEGWAPRQREDGAATALCALNGIGFACGRNNGINDTPAPQALASNRRRRAMSAPATDICSACKLPFTPHRSTARFCSARCRLINHRTSAVKTPARPVGEPADAFVSVSGPLSPSAPLLKKPETLTAREAKRLPRGVVRDERRPAMYRVFLSDGSLSDMVNLTRARDALAAIRDERAP